MDNMLIEKCQALLWQQIAPTSQWLNKLLYLAHITAQCSLGALLSICPSRNDSGIQAPTTLGLCHLGEFCFQPQGQEREVHIIFTHISPMLIQWTPMQERLATIVFLCAQEEIQG